MRIHEFISRYTPQLEIIHGISEASSILKSLLADRLGIDFLKVHQLSDQIISSVQLNQLSKDIDRLNKGEPLQYVTGIAWFCNLPIPIEKGVLIPRPETEELVFNIKNEVQIDNPVILDICSGSGCISFALKNYFPNARVIGCDVSFDALNQARNSSLKLNLPVEWFWVDVLEDNWDSLTGESYDLIISNPPYITNQEAIDMHENVLQYEPHLALFAPDEDPLAFYRKIILFAKSRLNPGGSLWFECNKHYSKEIGKIFNGFGFVDIVIEKDLSGNERFVSGFL